jgi:RNA-dependent RNA polymerase
MDCFMQNVPFSVNELQLNRQLQPTLHGPYFEPVFQGGAPFDYRIQLFKGKNKRRGHGGYGIITVPTEAIGQRLIQLGSIQVRGGLVSFRRSNKSAPPERIAMVQRPYQDPAVRERQEQRRADLATEIGIRSVQFCWTGFGKVSIEWEDQGSWSVSFDDNNRAMVLKRQLWRIIVRNTTVESIEEDGDDYCHLTLEVPPTLEVEPQPQAQQPQTQEGDPFNLSALLAALFSPPRPPRERKSTLEGQEAIIPFVNLIRFRFASPRSGLEEFRGKVRLIERNIHAYDGPEPDRGGLFTSHSLGELQVWCEGQQYDIAFQVHAILCRRLIAPAMLLNLIPTLDQVVHDLESHEVVDILKRFGRLISEPDEGMEDWRPEQFLQICIDNRATTVSRRVVSPEEASRLFECHHVTITPTSQLLAGPIPETSNRVLRWYSEYQHHFLRVEFAEEDGNNLRMDREVDNAKFVQQRFGGVLKNGIKVAGRRFEFLAYSQSALREHAVWFMSPFGTLSNPISFIERC